MNDAMKRMVIAEFTKDLKHPSNIQQAEEILEEYFKKLKEPIEYSVAAGLIKVIMSPEKELLDHYIDPMLVKSKEDLDPEFLGHLTVIACQQAVKRLAQRLATEAAKATVKINLLRLAEQKERKESQ